MRPRRPRPPALCVPAVLLALAATVALCGCATIVRGTTQPVAIASDPPGALVEVDGEAAGHTPTVAILSRASNHTVRLSAPGYEPAGVTLRRGLTGWAWGNAVFLALPGLLVDAHTGALYELSPARVDTTLVPSGPPR